MTEVRLYRHIFEVQAPKVFEVESLADWLLLHYGPSPDVRVQVFVGEPSEENEITGDISAIMACDELEYTILESPGFELTALQWAVIAFVSSLAVTLLTPKPEMPGNVNRTQSSPNNALSDRANKVRLGERTEDIFGTVESIPSLMMPTYTKYIGHKLFEYGYYCTSIGYNDIALLSDADTLIADITNASAAVYWPFTSPNSGDAPVLQIGDPIIDQIVTVRRATEVDGITLKALNQIQLPTSATYNFLIGGTLTQEVRQPNLNSIAGVGDELVITMTDYQPSSTGEVSVVASTRIYSDTEAHPFIGIQAGDSVTISGFVNAGNNGTFTVTAFAAGYVAFSVWVPGKITVSTGSQVDETAPTVTVTIPPQNYSGTYEIATIDDANVTLLGTSWPRTFDKTCSVQVVGVTEWTDWMTLPQADRAEVWCNILASNGMYKDNGGKSTAEVEFEIEIEKLHATTHAPLGIVEVVTGSLSGSVTDERAETVENATAWTGPARVRMRRTTQYDYAWGGTVVDEIKWKDLYSVVPETKTHFGNKTTIHTVTQATARATAVKSRQLNCINSRLLPTYNGSTFSGAFDSEGRHVSGTIHQTSKIIDIIAAVAIDPYIGRRDISEIDLVQMWGVQQELDAWSLECGQFNYTFDSDNTSFEETLTLIADSAFCIPYRQNGVVRLAFDKLQTSSVSLFTHRNSKPNSLTIKRTFANDADYDGVQFVYTDPDENTSETINLPLDGSAIKPKKFEIAGIRSFDQAWYRANREYAKIKGQRLSLETVTTLDGRSLLPNARISVVDNTRFKSYDGEVVGQSGLELTLSQPVKFTPGQAHSIILMQRDGGLQSIACTAGSDSRRVVIASPPSESIVTTHGAAGIRTIFSFAADNARDSQAYLVQEIDVTDSQYVTVRAINYSADFYAADQLAVPDKAAIINS